MKNIPVSRDLIHWKFLFREESLSKLNHAFGQFVQTRESQLALVHPVDEILSDGSPVGSFEGYGATRFLQEWINERLSENISGVSIVPILDIREQIAAGVTTALPEVVSGLLKTTSFTLRDIRNAFFWFITRLLAIVLLLWICAVATIIFVANISQTISIFDVKFTIEGILVFIELYWLPLLVGYIVLLFISYLVYSSSALDRLKQSLAQFPSPREARRALVEEISPRLLASGLSYYLRKKRLYVIVIDDAEHLPAADIFALRDTLENLLSSGIPIFFVLSFGKDVTLPPVSQVDWALRSLLDSSYFVVNRVELPLISLEKITVIVAQSLTQGFHPRWEPSRVEIVCGQVYEACALEMSLPGEDLTSRIPLRGRLDLILGFWARLIEDEKSLEVQSITSWSQEEWREKFRTFLKWPVIEVDELLASLATQDKRITQAVLRVLLTVRSDIVKLTTLDDVLEEQHHQIESAIQDLYHQGILQLNIAGYIRLLPHWRLRLESVWSSWYIEDDVGERVFRLFLDDPYVSHHQLAEQALLAAPSQESIEILVGYGISTGLETHSYLTRSLRYLVGKQAAFDKWKTLVASKKNIDDEAWLLTMQWQARKGVGRRFKAFRIGTENIDLPMVAWLVSRILFATGRYYELVSFVETDWPHLLTGSLGTLRQREIESIERNIRTLHIRAMYELGQWNEVIKAVDDLKQLRPRWDWSEAEVFRAEVEETRINGLRMLGKNLVLPGADEAQKAVFTRLKLVSNSPAMLVRGLRRESMHLVIAEEDSHLSNTELVKRLSMMGQAAEVAATSLESRGESVQTVELLIELANIYLGIATLYFIFNAKNETDVDENVGREFLGAIEPKTTWPGFELFSSSQLALFEHSMIRTGGEKQYGEPETLIYKLLRLTGFVKSQTATFPESDLSHETTRTFEAIILSDEFQQFPDTFRQMAAKAADKALDLALHIGATRLACLAFREIGYLKIVGSSQQKEDLEKISQAAAYFQAALINMDQIGQRIHLPWVHAVLGTAFSDYNLQYSSAAQHFYSAAESAEELQYPNLHVGTLFRRAATIYHNTIVLYPEKEEHYRSLVLSCNERAKECFEKTLSEDKVDQDQGVYVQGRLRTISLELAQQYQTRMQYDRAVTSAEDALLHCDDPTSIEQREAYGLALQIKGIALAQQDKLQMAMNSLVMAHNHFSEWSKFHEFQVHRIISTVLLNAVQIKRYEFTPGDYYRMLGAGLGVDVERKVKERWQRDSSFIMLPGGAPRPDFQQSWLGYLQEFSSQYKSLFDTQSTLSPELRMELALGAELLANMGEDTVRYYREALALYSSVNEAKRALRCLRENLLKFFTRGLYTFEQVMEDLALALSTDWEDKESDLDMLAEIREIWRQLSFSKFEIDFLRSDRKLRRRKIKVLLATEEKNEAKAQLLLLRNEIREDVSNGNNMRLTAEDIEVYDELYGLAINKGDSEEASQYLAEKRQMTRDLGAFALLDLVSMYSSKQNDNALRLLAYIRSLNPSEMIHRRIKELYE